MTTDRPVVAMQLEHRDGRRTVRVGEEVPKVLVNLLVDDASSTWAPNIAMNVCLVLARALMELGTHLPSGARAGTRIDTLYEMATALVTQSTELDKARETPLQ
jgi:hypothetical protein